MTKTWCVGGRHYSDTVNKNVYEKMNPRSKKLGKVIKGTCSIKYKVVMKVKFFLSK